MEVILRQHVDNLGKRGEIVKVAAGYARNYLLPRKLALLASEGNKRHVERERKIMESREADERGQAQAMAARLESVEIKMARRVGDTEQLYRLGDLVRHRRLPEGQGLRDRSAQADPAGADQEPGRALGAAPPAPRRHRRAQGAGVQGRRDALGLTAWIESLDPGRVRWSQVRSCPPAPTAARPRNGGADGCSPCRSSPRLSAC